MRGARVLLLLLLVAHAAHAFNKTHFAAGPIKRSAAAARDEFYARLPGPATWDEVGRAINALQDVSGGACTVRSVTQTALQTALVVACPGRSADVVLDWINAAIAPVLGVANVGAMVEVNGRVEHATSVTTQMSAPWSLDVLDTTLGASAAFERDQRFHYAYTGAGIIIYTVDTGVDGALAEFATGRATGWLNTVDGSGSVLDGHGHGTHVASLAIGRTFGVAKGATLRAIKALDNDGYGDVGSVCDAIAAVLEECAGGDSNSNGIVINLSINGPKSSAIDSALAQLAQMCSCAIVVAAGNNGGDACTSSPAGQKEGVLTVGALDTMGARASFSNYGACVDLMAPGVSVPGAALPATGQSSVEMSGSSMSTPLVAGLCALMMQRRKQAGASNVGALAMADVVAASTVRGGRLHMGVAATGTTTPPPLAPPPPPPAQQAPGPLPLHAPAPVRKTSEASLRDIGWAIGVGLLILVVD